MTDNTDSWESDIAGLLNDLAGVQRDLLDVLGQKRQMIAAGDGVGLSTVATRENQLVARLQACQTHRQQLLQQAAGAGLPSDSIRSLSRALPAKSRGRFAGDIQEAQERSRILQHECLTNWVLVQRTLLHLSQLVEIIATGGRMKPTYGNGSDSQDHGALVDRAV
jgi:flagellar biosynthesis/type III secretory pathway chaperone